MTVEIQKRLLFNPFWIICQFFSNFFDPCHMKFCMFDRKKKLENFLWRLVRKLFFIWSIYFRLKPISTENYCSGLIFPPFKYCPKMSIQFEPKKKLPKIGMLTQGWIVGSQISGLLQISGQANWEFSFVITFIWSLRTWTKLNGDITMNWGQ